MSNTQKAYSRGYRMGKYIKARDGIGRANERGSKAQYIYQPRMKGLIEAYDRGYKAALSEK